MITIGRANTTSPAAPGSAAGLHIGNLDRFERVTLVVALLGATAGVLDVYLQTSYESEGSTWYDMAHFPQLAAGGAAVTYGLEFPSGAAVAAPQVLVTAALTVNTRVLGMPLGCRARLFYVAGASTSAGAVQTLNAYGQRF